MWAKGGNSFGQLGDNTRLIRNRFVQVIAGDVQSVAAGAVHTVVVKQDGSLWSTGLNQFGQLGLGKDNLKSIIVPTEIP